MLKDCIYGVFTPSGKKKVMKGPPELLLNAIEDGKAKHFWLYEDGVTDKPTAYCYITGDYEEWEVMNQIAIPLGCNHIQFDECRSLTRIPAQA